MDSTRFVNYCYDFYGPKGIYPMNINKSNILAALAIVKLDTKIEFVGDSVDRERVRDVLMDVMSFKCASFA